MGSYLLLFLRKEKAIPKETALVHRAAKWRWEFEEVFSLTVFSLFDLNREIR